MKKLLALTISLLLLTGCAPAAEQTVCNIAVVPQVWSDELNDSIGDYVKDRAHLNVYQTMVDEADSKYQVLLVEDLIAMEVDAICLDPIDEQAMEPMLQKAEDAGVLVFTGEELLPLIDLAEAELFR